MILIQSMCVYYVMTRGFLILDNFRDNIYKLDISDLLDVSFNTF